MGAILAQNLIQLIVNNTQFASWETVNISQGIDQLAGSFSLVVSNKISESASAVSIQAGDACIVKIGNDIVITGYVDSLNISLSANSHTINVQGRDKTGDLVDCTAPANEYLHMTFEHIATQLLKPYGIGLKNESSIGRLELPRKSAGSAESVHATLEKMAKAKGVLLISDGLGNLVQTRAGLSGRANDKLAIGSNILSIDFEHNFSDLYSEISVKGQAHGATSNAGTASSYVLSGAPALNIATVKTAKKQAVQAVKNSTAIARYRPLVLIAEEQANNTQCVARAQWEASTREAKSKKINITVQGWRQSNGALWQLNTLVKVEADFIGVNENMLISGIEFSLTDAGSITKLSLIPPLAYALLPEIPEKTAAQKQTRGSKAGSKYQLSGLK